MKNKVAKTRKDKFIKEVRSVMFSQLGDHLITDIDEKVKPILAEFDMDYENYCRDRRKGKILRFDHYLVMWLNGALLAWNILTNSDDNPIDGDKVEQNDIIPDFKEIAERSRTITVNGRWCFLGECRLTDTDPEAFNHALFLKGLNMNKQNEGVNDGTSPQ